LLLPVLIHFARAAPRRVTEDELAIDRVQGRDRGQTTDIVVPATVQCPLGMIRLTELSNHLQARLNDAAWTVKREIIPTLIQRIELGWRR